MVTPTERMLTILRLIGGEGRLASSDEIRTRMGEQYGGPSGRRKWRRDIDVLVSRGLVESDVTSPTTPNRTGVRRRRTAPKPTDLHLTADEHAALARARGLLRNRISEAAPLERPEGTKEAPIDTATRVLRFVEEHGDEVAVTQLAEWMGCTTGDVCRLMEGLMGDLTGLDEPLVMSLQPGYVDDESVDDAGEVAMGAVYVLRSETSRGGARPLRGRGMDELGFFPYSRAETDDRLALIDEALGSEEIDDATKHHLRWAGGKLDRWRRILLEGPMS